MTPKNKIKKAKRLTLVFDISKKKYEKALISFGKKKRATITNGKKSKHYQCWCFFRLEIVF